MKPNFPYNTPLKQPLPCLLYDIALFSTFILKTVDTEFPPYLEEFELKLLQFNSQLEQVKPKRFPNKYRLYIFDNRLNLLFAALEEPGQLVYDFREYSMRKRKDEEYAFGDGTAPNSGGLPMSEDWENMMMQNCIVSFGFIPSDLLAMNMALIFSDEKMKEHHYLSSYQTAYLLERLKKHNLVDWEALTKDEFTFGQ